MKIHLVHLNVPIFQQLQLEEALLRADNRNWCLINQGSPPAIVMGISGKQDLLVHPESRLPVIRRFSGGGTVVVDENTLFVTWICNAKEVNIPAYPEKIHRWTEEIYKPLFKGHPFALRENDYVLGERKFGGNAQYIRKDRWLHHSSLLWKFEPENMKQLLFPSKTPKYREQRDHCDFLCSLNQFFSCQATFLENVKKICHDNFDVCTVTAQEAMKQMELPHRQSTHYLTNVIPPTPIS